MQEFTPPDLHKEWSSLVSSENCPWVASELVTALPRIFNMGKAEREATIFFKKKYNRVALDGRQCSGEQLLAKRVG